MQVNTLTITTEQVSAGQDLFKLITYEMTTTAFCDCCANNATGTITELKRRGWHLGQNEQFCSDCN